MLKIDSLCVELLVIHENGWKTSKGKNAKIENNFLRKPVTCSSALCKIYFDTV